MAAVLDHDADGNLVRRAGIMGIVLAGGDVRPDDAIGVELPRGLAPAARTGLSLRARGAKARVAGVPPAARGYQPVRQATNIQKPNGECAK